MPRIPPPNGVRRNGNEPEATSRRHGVTRLIALARNALRRASSDNQEKRTGQNGTVRKETEVATRQGRAGAERKTEKPDRLLTRDGEGPDLEE